MKRAARAALKWKKAVSRRAAERVSGKDNNRTPPSGFEDVVSLLLQDSREKKALDKRKQRGGGETKRHARKGDIASTGSRQRVSACSSTRGVLDASVDADERRRSSIDGGKSAPECGSSDRKNKKRARGRSQSSFWCVPVCMFLYKYKNTPAVFIIRCLSLAIHSISNLRAGPLCFDGRRSERSMTKTGSVTLKRFKNVSLCNGMGSVNSGSNLLCEIS